MGEDSTQKPVRVKRKKLTPKQEKFVAEYVKTGNATEAAVVAYGTNRHTASVMGAENLAKPSVVQEVDSLARVMNESIRDLMHSNRMLQKAVEGAYKDLDSDDPQIQSSARRYLLDVHKTVAQTDPKEHQHKHLHKLLPARQ